MSLRSAIAAHCCCQLSLLTPPALCFLFSTPPPTLLPAGLPASQGEVSLLRTHTAYQILLYPQHLALGKCSEIIYWWCQSLWTNYVPHFPVPMPFSSYSCAKCLQHSSLHFAKKLTYFVHLSLLSYLRIKINQCEDLNVKTPRNLLKKKANMKVVLDIQKLHFSRVDVRGSVFRRAAHIMYICYLERERGLRK